MLVDEPGSQDDGATVSSASDDVTGRLRAEGVGLVVVRGAAIRTGGFGVGLALNAIGSVFMLRYLSVADFGRYMTVASLIAIVSGVSEAGLTTVGGREIALRTSRESRSRLVADLLGLRLAFTAVGVVIACGFAIAVGYDRTLVLGTLLMGAGLLLTNAQLTMTLPLTAELAIGRQTTSEIIRQVATVAGIVGLVALEAALLAFFGVQILVGVAVLVATPWLVGRAALVWRPTFDRAKWSALLRLALPLALSAAMAVIYFRILILLMSLLSTPVETGLFATSFRVIELLYALGAVAATVALPVFAASAHEHDRLRYMVQRTTEVALLASCYLAILVFAVAAPILRLLGGPEYEAAAPTLRIQVFALVPVFVAQVWLMALVAIGRLTALAIASAVGIVFAGGLGVILMSIAGAEGAAVAAVVGEAVLAVVLLLLLARSRPAHMINLRVLWKVALAAAALLIVVEASPAPLWVDVVAGNQRVPGPCRPDPCHPPGVTRRLPAMARSTRSLRVTSCSPRTGFHRRQSAVGPRLGTSSRCSAARRGRHDGGEPQPERERSFPRFAVSGSAHEDHRQR